MNEWMNAAEIAGIARDAGIKREVPTSVSGVFRLIKREEIHSRYPTQCRRRQKSGGGFEYHISIPELFPPVLKSALALRNLKHDASTPPAVAETPFEEFSGRSEAAARTEAKLVILAHFERFRKEYAGPLTAAQRAFAVAYNAHEIGGIPAWVRRVIETCSHGSLQRWAKTVKKGVVVELGGGYGNRKGTGTLDQAEGVAAFIARILVDHPQLSVLHIRTQVEAEFGAKLTVRGKEVNLPCLRAFQKWVGDWRRDNAQVLHHATNPDDWKNRHAARFGDALAGITAPNQLWEIDASPADVLLTDGRWSIYLVIDVATRRIMILVTRTPRTEAVLLLLRKAIMAWGVPQEIRTDNGSDFTSYWARAALAWLKIDHNEAMVFSPEEKAFVERHIGTLQHGLMPLLPGFVGHSVADRKAIEARKTFAKRLGESPEKAFCVTLTGEELQRHCDEWGEYTYGRAAHRGLDGKSPFEVAAAAAETVRRVDDDAALRLMLAPIAGKDGVRTVRGQTIWVNKVDYTSVDLPPWEGRQVFCRHDPQDMGKLYVFGLDGEEFVTVAENPELLGKSRPEMAMRQRAAQKAFIKEGTAAIRKAAKGIKAEDLARNAHEVARRNAGNVVALPHRAETYTTPAIDAAAEALKAAEPPKAVPLTEAQERLRKRLPEKLDQAKSAPSPMDQARERFRRAKAILADLDAGIDVDDAAVKWVTGYVKSAEYKAHNRTHGRGPVLVSG